MAELSETFKRLESDPQEGSQQVLNLLERFFEPFVQKLDEVLDKRLVRTLLQCLVASMRLRNNAQAWWLSELGSSLQGYEGYASSATAGTKRVGKLLRSVKWTVSLIDRYLLEKADEEVQRLKRQGKRIFCLWDGSVVEKAESEKLEGLCPVRVMGMQGSAGLIAGMSGVAQMAVTSWWTTKGVFATKLRDAEEDLLRITVRKWGRLLVHVFDRGYASGKWLATLSKYRVRFVIRWVKNHIFVTTTGEEKKLWQSGQGKKYLAHKEIRDPMTGEKMPCDLWWTALRHPSSGELLYLVRARVKKGIMYLITNDPVKIEEQAWEVFFTYRRRWQIESFFRYNKCEFALECPRLWSLEARLKLLGMVMLVYAFLLSLLDPAHHGLIQALLRFKCHRTGKRCQNVQAPLYRLHWALSRLWNDYRPRLTLFIPPSDDPLAAFSLINERERISQNWG
jgi:Transposase DDE domain